MDRSNHKSQEMELQLAKALSQIDHLRSQNDVLELTMEDAKNTNEKLSIHLARHESNGTARQLALAYADQVSFVYFFLLFAYTDYFTVCLLETDNESLFLINAHFKPMSGGFRETCPRNYYIGLLRLG